MKRTFVLCLLVVLALMLIGTGCGGGGGTGGGNGNGSTNGSVVNIKLKAFYNGTSSPATLSSLSAGSQIEIKLIGVNSITNAPTEVTVASLSTTAPASVASISGTVLTIIKASATSYTVSATYKGKSYQASFTAVAATPSISGFVRQPNGTPVAGVPIKFVNAAGTLLASAASGADGTFKANVPTTALYFAADLGSLPGYNNEFAYGAHTYAITLGGTCGYAPLPGHSTGNTPLTQDIVVFVQNPDDPPPPPDCNN